MVGLYVLAETALACNYYTDLPSHYTDLPSHYSLSYRLVFAVASLDSILFYDTQHSTPFAHVSNIHYSGITDMAWYVRTYVYINYVTLLVHIRSN